MIMGVQDWERMASVFAAGAQRARGWTHNTAMQQHAEVLDAQADRCSEIARELDGNPLVVHDYYHRHPDPDEPGTFVLHRHKHEHARGEISHATHGYASPGQLAPLFGGTS